MITTLTSSVDDVGELLGLAEGALPLWEGDGDVVPLGESAGVEEGDSG